MKVQQIRVWPQPLKRSLRRITISLSPKGLKPNRLQNISNACKVKPRIQKLSFMKEKPAETYSLAYYGDSNNSGKLTISVKRTQIPHLNRQDLNRHSRSIRASPTFIKDGLEATAHQRFRPKPLTPAVMRLYDFSEYRHRATANKSALSTQRLIHPSFKNEIFNDFRVGV
jgi:hypothetical protein